MSLGLKIEVNGKDIYTVAKPSGRIGALHMAILTKLASAGPTDPEMKVEDMRAEDIKEMNDAMSDIFLEWSEKVLPKIVIDGPFKYEDMPGEHQYAIFMALSSEVEMSGEPFRVIRDN